MELSSNAENRSTYDGNADYLVIDKIKSEPLDDVQPSDLIKVNQRKRRVCDGCEKTYASNQSLWNHKKICNRISNHTKRLDDDQSRNVVKTNQRKWHVCDRCEKTYSSYPSLWRHKKICQGDFIHTKQLGDDQLSDACLLKCTSSESIPEKPARKKRRTMYCVKCDIQFNSKTEHNEHFEEFHQLILPRCIPCQQIFTRKNSLGVHLKTKRHIQDDSYFFNDFIISKHFIWSPKIGEELSTLCNRNELYGLVDVVQEKQLIVGHVAHYLTNDFYALLQSGGDIKVKVTDKPIYTVFKGMKVPCTYYISGKLIFVDNIRKKVV